MDESGKLIAVIGDEVSSYYVYYSLINVLILLMSYIIIIHLNYIGQDTVTGFVLAGIGHRNVEGQNFLIIKKGL